MAVTTSLMTIEEFCKLAEDDGPVYHELRHGKLVAVPRARLKHQMIQSRLRRLLEPLAPPGALVEAEVAFRALPQNELRAADLAYVAPERCAKVDPENYIQGAPDLVIEVLSPSNTAAEIYDKEELCLNNGAKEFWVVDPDRRQVKVSTPDGRTITWHSGQEIPLPLFSGAGIAVDAIFA
jgi:Uma2 family endonuclease